jgi:membrane fusion protein (multidrug efflux system)
MNAWILCRDRSRSTRGAAAAALMLVGAVACGGPQEPPPAPPAPPQDKAVLVRTAPPQVEDVIDLAQLPGDLVPRRRAVLAAEVPGAVERVTVDLGDPVREGQVLVEIDTRGLEQAVAEAEAVFRQTQAQRSRAQNLFERRSITKKELLDAITNHDVAQARLASARLDLAKAQVKAPWTGAVASRRVEVGDYAVPGQPLIELVDGSVLKVRAPAPAADVPFLEEGARATVRVDALPGQVFEGRVRRLGAELDPASRTLPVEVEIPNPRGLLKPGMLARVEVPRRILDDALLVPLDAVVDLGEERVVYVAEEGRARRRPVELGAVVGQRVVVSNGLTAEDRLIVEGGRQVTDGQRIAEAGSRPAAAGDGAAGGSP